MGHKPHPGLGIVLLCACSQAPVGSAERPFTMYFVPSVDTEQIAASADEIVDYVERFVSQELYGQEEGFHIESAIPAGYIAVVEAFSTGRADFAALNTYSYVLAKDLKGYPVKALARVVRGDGETTYKAQIITRADSGIDDLQDITGRSFAYTDPTSTAGYLLPSNLLRREDVRPAQTTFGRGHDSVVTMVYEGQVDAGATYYGPPATEIVDGREVERPRDARRRVLTRFPDVMEKVKIIAFTDSTPNEAWVIRSDIYAEADEQARLEKAVRGALLSFAATEDGVRALEELYDISGLAAVDDTVYEGIRKLVLESDLDLEEAVQDK